MCTVLCDDDDVVDEKKDETADDSTICECTLAVVWFFFHSLTHSLSSSCVSFFKFSTLFYGGKPIV